MKLHSSAVWTQALLLSVRKIVLTAAWCSKERVCKMKLSLFVLSHLEKYTVGVLYTKSKAEGVTLQHFTQLMSLKKKKRDVKCKRLTVHRRDARALHCTALHCTALHCTALHCTALHCTALHCTAPHVSMTYQNDIQNYMSLF